MAGDSSFDCFCASRAPGSGRADFQEWTTRPENALRFEGEEAPRWRVAAGCRKYAPRLKMRSGPYRKGWGIECLFADAKTRGFNIGDTRITGHAKPAALLAVAALAMDVGVPVRKCHAMGRKGIRKKSRKRRAEILVQARVRHTAALAVA